MSKLIKLDRPDYARVIELASRGHSEETIADALWVGRSTYFELKKRDTDLVDALALGRAMEHDALVTRLRRLADDGNVVALLFLLKSRHGYRDQGPDTNAVAAVNVQINLPDAMTREQFARAVEVKTLPKETTDDE